jgi:hypothetical protein
MSDLVTSMPATGNSGGLQFMTKQGVLYPEEWEADMCLDGIPGSRLPVSHVQMPLSKLQGRLTFLKDEPKSALKDSSTPNYPRALSDPRQQGLTAELERLQAANDKAEQNLERKLLIHGRTLAERTQQVLQATQQLGEADPIMLPPPMSYMPPPMAFVPPPPPPPAPREAAGRGGRGGRGRGRGRGRGQADTYSLPESFRSSRGGAKRGRGGHNQGQRGQPASMGPYALDEYAPGGLAGEPNPLIRAMSQEEREEARHAMGPHGKVLGTAYRVAETANLRRSGRLAGNARAPPVAAATPAREAAAEDADDEDEPMIEAADGTKLLYPRSGH